MGQSFTNLLYHVVFSTKNRIPIITPEIQERLYEYMGGVIRNEQGILLEIGGVADHVHLLVKVPPSKAVADFMRVLKTSSSKWVHETWPEASQFAWQTGYGAFTVSHSIVPKVRRYIQEQEKHHRHMTFEEELIRILEMHGVEFEQQYV